MIFDRVAGGERISAQLARQAAHPSHALMLSGSPGAHLAEAARALAAALLCEHDGCGECGVCDRVWRMRHPDVTEVEPVGAIIRVDQAAEIEEVASRAPFEAARKVIIIHEAERLNEQAQNKLLKAFEEPSATTHYLLVTAQPDELLPTVRSRCQRLTFEALRSADIVQALLADGLPQGTAELVTHRAGGRLDRARRLRPGGAHEHLWRAFSSVPGELDGSGAAAANLAAGLSSALDDAQSVLKEQHKRETAELERELEQSAYDNRTVSGLLRRQGERHKRIESGARRLALEEGLSAIEARYRDALLVDVAVDVRGGRGLKPTLEADPGDRLAVDGSSCLRALDVVAEVRRSLEELTSFNEMLLLERILLSLPPGR